MKASICDNSGTSQGHKFQSMLSHEGQRRGAVCYKDKASEVGNNQGKRTPTQPATRSTYQHTHATTHASTRPGRSHTLTGPHTPNPQSQAHSHSHPVPAPGPQKHMQPRLQRQTHRDTYNNPGEAPASRSKPHPAHLPHTTPLTRSPGPPIPNDALCQRL